MSTPPYTPQPINRLGPSTPPQMQMPANGYTFMNSPYNFQAQMLAAGNPGQGMYGYSSQLPNSYMMQRFLPEVTRHAMTNNQAFPFGGYQTPWTANGLTASYNPNMLTQRPGDPAPTTPPPTTPPTTPQWPGLPPGWTFPGLNSAQQQAPQQMQAQPAPQQTPQARQEARQEFRQSLTPEQVAMRKGENGNRDFMQSLTPAQAQMRQAAFGPARGMPQPGNTGIVPPQPQGQQGGMPMQNPMQNAMSAYQQMRPQGMPQGNGMGFPQGYGMGFGGMQFNPMMRFNLGMGF